ncbi:MAG TPA: sigma-70 family RNA polymerase sigma factor [Rhizomicrobium sp.]|jgi:RNA polymerase sigma-70 factor (ECF subfamily)|nr:sigma-70 family RNA polymerase sigma factor [Rhizomicrobium sp.]
MDRIKWLAESFEANRPRLRNVAYRMLGSLSEAEDAVQEAWFRLSGAEAGGIENLGGWLTTVVARISLDMLRARKARREETLDTDKESAKPSKAHDPEQEAILAESVGLALMVVLQKLDPAERIAFVLHDMFGLPFQEIAPIVERTPDAARQLASRARRRVQGAPAELNADLSRQRVVVDAFLAASRKGDLEGLLAVLDPDIVFRADAAAVRLGGPAQLNGADNVARVFLGRAQAARTALVDGGLGLVVAPKGQLMLALRVGIHDGRIASIQAIAEPAELAGLDLALLPGTLDG